jgi:SAM-dependent methyltransferase
MGDRGSETGSASNGGFDYDAELRRYHRRLVEAFEAGPGDHVLDIGCGTGQTTRSAARLAVQGSAFGVDISPVVVERARRISAAEDVHNVRFEQADAQVHPFPQQHFALGVSRFGTMFFADPVDAFANIARALRPGARLVQLVWQDRDRQEWAATIQRAFADPPPVGGTGKGAFSLADPATVDGVLTAAGFTDVSVTDVSEPVWYGADPDAAADAVLTLRMANKLLPKLDADEAERAAERLRSVLQAHNTDDGVWFDSHAWLITARR